MGLIHKQRKKLDTEEFLVPPQTLPADRQEKPMREHPKKIEEKVDPDDKIYKMLEESNKRQIEILEVIKGLRTPGAGTLKQETRQEKLNPAKTEEQVAAELLLTKKENAK